MFKACLLIPEVISTDPEVENKLMILLEIEKRKTETTYIESALAVTLERTYHRHIKAYSKLKCKT